MPIRNCDGLYNERLRDPDGLFISFLCLLPLSKLHFLQKDRERVLRRIQEQVGSASRLAIEESVQSSDWTETGVPQCPRRFAVGDRTIDLERRLIAIGDFKVHLTQLECRLLDRMWAKRNRTIPSEKLVDVLWGPDARRGTHSLRSVVKNVRRKLEPDPGHPRYLVVDRRIGYRLRVS